MMEGRAQIDEKDMVGTGGSGGSGGGIGNVKCTGATSACGTLNLSAHGSGGITIG